MMMRVSQKFKKVMIPVGRGDSGEMALAFGKALGEDVVLVGVVNMADGKPLSTGAQPAREMRKRLYGMSKGPQVRYKSRVVVSEKPWEDLKEVIEAENPDILLVEWKNGTTACGLSIGELLSNEHCNIGIVSGKIEQKFTRTLVAVRGGPHAELALQVGLGLGPEQLDVLHINKDDSNGDAPFKGLKRVLRNLPEVNLRNIVTNDPGKTICEAAMAYDVVVLGATASQNVESGMIGPVALKLLRESKTGVMVVKTRQAASAILYDESAGVGAISILVDKWFAENTFHADEFSDLGQLMALKERMGVTTSLALPALNEEKTVGKVIGTIKSALMENVPLLDEMVLIDSNSTDRTREIVEDLGIPVYIHQEILPELGGRIGKGEALWKSLLVTRGDLIAWIDTDIVNIHPRFVYGVLGPLLQNENIQYVKGFYRRPLKVGDSVQAGGGGRVTELTARPLLNLFFPELSGVVQPLSGEYAGRRSALEKIGFFSGYGVEIGMLIDIFEQYGLRAIGQVDLVERIHHSQELDALSKMSFAIIQAVLRKVEARYDRAIVEDVNKTMKLIRHARDGYFLELQEVAELERPPIISLPEYQSRRQDVP